MKALTLTQPWAALVALGIKRVETRSWSTRYRGPLLIHAASTWTAPDRLFAERLAERGLLPERWQGPLDLSRPPDGGCLVAHCVLDVVVPATPADIARLVLEHDLAPVERELGDYFEGRWLWLLDSVVAIAKPIPWRGRLGLWEGPNP